MARMTKNFSGLSLSLPLSRSPRGRTRMKSRIGAKPCFARG